MGELHSSLNITLSKRTRLKYLPRVCLWRIGLPSILASVWPEWKFSQPGREYQWAGFKLYPRWQRDRGDTQVSFRASPRQGPAVLHIEQRPPNYAPRNETHVLGNLNLKYNFLNTTYHNVNFKPFRFLSGPPPILSKANVAKRQKKSRTPLT
jgi:hypothetical protein